jgi:hypothetical protein
VFTQQIIRFKEGILKALNRAEFSKGTMVWKLVKIQPAIVFTSARSKYIIGLRMMDIKLG